MYLRTGKLNTTITTATTGKMAPRPTKKPNSSKKAKPTTNSKPSTSTPPENTLLDNNNSIPLTLQQLLLNVFQSALLLNTNPQAQTQTQTDADANTNTNTEEKLDLKPLIQTIKSHLYNRDFDSAFTDANDELLRAYALRWSATRALGYAGVFKAVLKLLFPPGSGSEKGQGEGGGGQIVCIGGGAGAEIVALGGVWRDMNGSDPDSDSNSDSGQETAKKARLTVTAVDIADWSSVVDRLDATMRSSGVSSLRSHPAPLIQQPPSTTAADADAGEGEGEGEGEGAGAGFNVKFHRANILTMPDSELNHLYNPTPTSTPKTLMVTLMFTLNELFSTSMAKATAFLLRTTDAVQPGTLLLVVDSPGSYSSLALRPSSGATTGTTGEEKRYPMKFLLDHTLLSVAVGKWGRVLSQDSRWWRRDAARLWYDVGEGAGLEDMRYQVHLYRRLK